MSQIITKSGLQSEGRVDLTDEILGALLFPTSGAKMATLLAKDAVKTVAQIWLAPGGGLPKQLRKLAIEHDVVRVSVRGEVYYGRPTPFPYEFHQSTLRWALKRTHQIAVWSAPFPEFADDIGEWLCDEAFFGSRFQMIIETVPLRAAEWREFIARWKGPRTEVRFFGPEGVLQ
jgi:hypothetical protein